MKAVFTVFFILLSLMIYAQNHINSYGLSSHYGFIFAHSKDVQNTEGANPFGIQLDYSRTLIDSATWNLCNCYPRTGLMLQWKDYDRALLGQSVALAAYIEPFFNYKQRLQFSLKGSAGPAWLSNPYHAQKNPSNQSYSLPISGYVALGIGLHYRINPHWQIKSYAHYNHISNGGLKEPNKGINWPTMEIGLTYFPTGLHLPERKRNNGFSVAAEKIKWQAIGFVSSKTAKAGEKERHLIYGIQLKASKRISAINQLSLGGEWMVDNATQELEQRANRNTNTQRIGLLVGHGFLMGKFTLTQEFGVYLTKPSSYFKPVYQRYGLNYRINRKLEIGMGLLAHGHIANFLDFRLAYQIK